MNKQTSRLKLIIKHRHEAIQKTIAFQKVQITGNYHNQIARAYASGKMEGHEVEARFLDMVLDLITSELFDI